VVVVHKSGHPDVRGYSISMWRDIPNRGCEPDGDARRQRISAELCLRRPFEFAASRHSIVDSVESTINSVWTLPQGTSGITPDQVPANLLWGEGAGLEIGGSGCDSVTRFGLGFAVGDGVVSSEIGAGRRGAVIIKTMIAKNKAEGRFIELHSTSERNLQTLEKRPLEIASQMRDRGLSIFLRPRSFELFGRNWS